MGRLLRKKSPAKKKRKPGDESSFQGSNGSETGGVSVSSLGEKVKPFPSSQKRPSILAKAPEPVRNITNQSLQFLREVKAELKKVTWPSRKQTTGSTVVVIILVMIISFFLGAVDIALSSLIRIVLQ